MKGYWGLRAFWCTLIHVLIGAGVSARAEVLKPTDIFNRCYIRMVRNVPVESDPLFIEVKNGIKAPEVACTELFDRAQFGADGVLKKRTNAEAKAILRTFHDLHSSWFQSRTNPFAASGYVYRDGEEAPLYYTRAAFQPDEKWGSVVTLESGLKGVRDQDNYPNEINDFQAQRILTYNAATSYAAETELVLSYTQVRYVGTRFISDGELPLRIPNGQSAEFGHLVGVKSSDPLILPSFRSFPATAPDIRESVISTLTNFNANKHFGGGIIGSQAFLINNVNLPVNQLPDGYTNINRRLTARVFEDLLCHQLPTLNDEDVVGEVIPDSEHAFQRTSSCMRCHSSIDGMGFGFRNYFVFRSAPNRTPDRSVGLHLEGITAFAPVATATTFAVQPPEGRLHYRELISGTRRDYKFNTLSQLGKQIASGNDLYTCAAKRYYQFFTGVNVDLTQKATAALDKTHQNKVLALGKAFKSHQSVRLLLKDIFSSDAFRASNYLTEK